MSDIQVIIMAKKKFDWNKVLTGFKRPLVALVAAGVVYLGFDNEAAALVAGAVVERVWATAEFYLQK